MPGNFEMLSILLILIVFPTIDGEYDTSTLPSINPYAFVNCQHVQKLLHSDASMFNLGETLDKCWHHGVTMDEIEAGTIWIDDREDPENYGFEDLHLPCSDVFNRNLTKLTSRLVQDYINCLNAGVLDDSIHEIMEARFSEIVNAYTIGNLSVTIDEDTLVDCGNTSKRIVMLCRQFGLTQDQWTLGFLRYYYNDKWVVEENIDELSLTCDQVFNARIQEEAYDDSVLMFIKCQETLQVDPEIRDIFEKKNADKLNTYRAQEYPDVKNVDLRGYVSCKHLIPFEVRNGLVSASMHAYESCKKRGVTYEELQNGREVNTRDDVKDVEKLYINCESVFNDELWSFTTGLINDYGNCKDAGKIHEIDQRIIQKKFEKLFKIIGTRNPLRRSSITDQLVRCTNFTEKLSDLCRQRGSTLAQELRGIGSLARNFNDKWLNTEELEKLYVRCDDIFDDYVKYMKDIPIEQYMQCRWTEISDTSKDFIDKKIARLYKNRHRGNGTRYMGDTDVEISSVILFD